MSAASGSNTAPRTCSSAQRRDERARGAASSRRPRGLIDVHHLPERGELFVLARRGDEQRAARRQDRPVGEAGRRRFEEGAAGERQRAHLRRAVAFEEERRRAAGRVVAGLALALEDDGAPVRREEVADRRAGDAGTDDQEVAVGVAGIAAFSRATRMRGASAADLA